MGCVVHSSIDKSKLFSLLLTLNVIDRIAFSRAMSEFDGFMSDTFSMKSCARKGERSEWKSAERNEP